MRMTIYELIETDTLSALVTLTCLMTIKSRDPLTIQCRTEVNQVAKKNNYFNKCG